jgi:hypothetical protein
MRAEQDWCLQCGTGAPGSLPARSRGLRSAAAVLAALAVLVAGAAAAAYAALSKSSAKPRPVSTLASTPPPSASPPPAATPPPTASTAPAPRIPKLGPPAALKPPLVKPTKPLQVPSGVKSPATSTSPSAPAPATTPTPSTGTKTHPGKGTPAPAAKQPAPIVLDTNAASTYNPYGYPASNFGDPTLAVDGDASTAWTALVDPAVAPKMAEGLLIDLKSAQRLSALALTTSTPGMTVQVYGAAASPAPASITDPAWVRLSSPLVANKAKERIALAQPKRSFRLVTLWISNAPSSAVGTPEAPGHVRVNEIELFAAS